jgi:hypothetical protein
MSTEISIKIEGQKVVPKPSSTIENLEQTMQDNREQYLEKTAGDKLKEKSIAKVANDKTIAKEISSRPWPGAVPEPEEKRNISAFIRSDKYAVANGFTYQKHTITSFLYSNGLRIYGLQTERDRMYRIYSGDGTRFVESQLPESSFSSTTNMPESVRLWMTGSAVPPPTGGGTWTTTTTRKTTIGQLKKWRAISYEGRTWPLIEPPTEYQALGAFDAIGLPVRGRTYIHVVIARDWGQFRVTRTAVTTTEDRTGTGPPCFFTYGSLTQEITKTPFIEAFIVNDTSVRKIPVPETLAAKLLELPILSQDTSLNAGNYAFESNPPGSCNGIFDGVFLSEPYGQPFIDYAGFLASSYGLAPPWEVLGVNDAISPRQYREIKWEGDYPERTNKDADAYVANSIPVGANEYGPYNLYFSPGIYAVLKRNGQEWRDIQWNLLLREFKSKPEWPALPDNPYDLDDAETFLASEENGWLPRQFLAQCINENTCAPEDGVIGYDATRPVVDEEGNASFSWRPGGVEKNRTDWRPNQVNLDPPEGLGSGYYTSPGFHWQTMHVWDGGKPNYCKQQLLALGFTIQDLTPTPPP